MNTLYFDPTSTSGLNGYINYKMSGGDSGRSGGSGGSGGGSGCGPWIAVIIFLVILEIMGAFYK